MYIQVISLICRLYIVKQRLLLHSKFLANSAKQTFSTAARGINEQPGVQTGPAITRYLHSTL